MTVDKYEYKIRSEEIKSLIAQGEYADAAAIADTIDWRRVKSVMTLCTISDLYKINRRLEDAKDMLLMAYDRYPGGRSIVYSLCELSIKIGEFVQAVEYYKEFVQIAPKDSGRYVLQYKLYEAQDVSLEERIAVLEELKSKDYSEKWAYELAYLYHRVGLTTKCVEECDELVLWFGEGKYVVKALELKMLHEPITEKQREKYEELKGIRRDEPAYQEETPVYEEQVNQTYEENQTTQPYEEDLDNAPTKEISLEEPDIQVKLMNVGQYDTINIQKELAENMKELWEGQSVEEQPEEDQVTGESSEDTQGEDQDFEEQPEEEQSEDGHSQEKVEEVFFGETGELDATANKVMEALKNEAMGGESELTASLVGDMKEWSIGEPPEQFKKILGMEYDGQISMVVPESEQVEKQITGQISLQDVLLEWERMKKDSEQKRMEAVRQRVMQQTGAMFTEFDEATRDGLLEQLEKDRMLESEQVSDEEADTEESYTEEVDPEEADSEEADSDDIEEFDEADNSTFLDESEEVEEFEECPEETEDLEAFDENEDTTEELDEVEELEEVEEQPLEEEGALEETEEIEEEILEEEENLEEENSEEEENLEEENLEEETLEGENLEEEASEEEGNLEEEVSREEDNSEEETLEEELPKDIKDVEKKSDNQGKKKPVVPQVKQDKPVRRTLTPVQKQLFGTYILNKATREQIIYAMDNISMAPYTGNIVITGEDSEDTFNLAKKLLKEVQQSDSNFSGKIAKISSKALANKGVEETFSKLANGALIIQNAGSLGDKTITEIQNALEIETRGLVVVFEDARPAMHKMMRAHQALTDKFPIEINIEGLDDSVLVAFAQKYARDQEYSIDELGVLALHTVIAERQTSDHSVTIGEVKEIMDDAIHHATRKTLGHFFDILVAKRYDDEDMIIIKEKDFIH